MKLVLATDRFQVYDDFLPPKAFAAVWRYVQEQEYVRVHETGWDKAWRLHDGEPLGGEVIHSARSRHAGSRERPLARLYPTQSAIDGLLGRLSRAALRFRPLIGKRGADWTIFTARAFLYPRDTGLSWHTDGTMFSGAFTFFAHPEWSCTWGGELLVARTGKRPSRAAGGVRHCLDDRAESEALAEVGLGDYIYPKPNRLVVLGSGPPHMINRVHPSAGAHVRSTITGFFVRATPEDRM